jgi:hypothetical protein
MEFVLQENGIYSRINHINLWAYKTKPRVVLDNSGVL